jgi:uncharacterized peroxidase-related enzyme
MMFIETFSENEAAGPVAEMYASERASRGHVPNFARAFSRRSSAYSAWRRLIGTITANMDPRLYELATLAAARRLRSSYCMLAHGSLLLKLGLHPSELRAVVEDHHRAGLDTIEVAVMDLADKVAGDARSVTQADIDRLRALGLTDGEITDVVLAAAARCFFSKVLDALGAEPDERYSELEPALRDVLTVGRPIAVS